MNTTTTAAVMATTTATTTQLGAVDARFSLITTLHVNTVYIRYTTNLHKNPRSLRRRKRNIQHKMRNISTERHDALLYYWYKQLLSKRGCQRGLQY
jgi:hypothetical protein